jgi:hypothetical protein
MKGNKGKYRYQFMSLLHELFLFFVSSFLLFPSHIKRIILCFVYSDDHQSSFIYPYLEEEDLHTACIVYVDSVSLPQPIHKDEFYIQIPLESDHSCNLEEIETNEKLFQISISSVTIEPSNQLVNPHDYPTAFQTRIRMKMFKPLRMPYLIHPYPLDCLEYLPQFSGEDHVIAEKHLGSFENFVDQFEIIHDDVIMRLFSKHFFRDVAVWFKSLRVDSIGSWIELSNDFSKHYGENKSFNLYLVDFYALRREEEEALSIFNIIFYNIYHSMPLEIWPIEITAMVYYVMMQHSKLVLLLLEKKSSSLACFLKMSKKLRRTFVLLREFEIQFTLKICMHQSKETVSMFHILSKKTVSMKQILNNSKSVSIC